MTTVISGVQSSIQQITGAMNGLIQKANAAAESQTKLQTVMKERMSATEDDVKAINELISKQTELGVVGGTVQRAGMQQLATFASQKQTLLELLPAMNNLLVQQNGLNSTTENATSIANLMGKALMGNASALTRVGITLTDAQKELIKTGDEGTRAKTIAEAITQNVGNMNAEMAKTDAGKAKQSANEFAGLQTKIGALLSPLQTLITRLGQLGFAATGAIQLVTAIKALGTSMGITSAIAKMHAASMLTMQLAMGGASVAATILSVSLTALKVAIRGVLIATGVGIVIWAVTAAFEALISSTDKSTSSLNGNASAMSRTEKESQRLAQRQKDTSAQIGSSVGDLAGKYEVLRSQWKALKTDHERNAWIKKNQSAFGELGLSVNSVNDAYDYFVRNSSKVVAALKAIAEARAWEQIYQHDLQALEEKRRQKGTVANGVYYTVHKAGEQVSGQSELPFQWVRAGLRPQDYIKTVDHNGLFSYMLKNSGAAKINALEKADANTRRSDFLGPEEANLQQSSNMMVSKQQDAMKAASSAGVDLNGNLTASNGSSTGTTRHGNSGTTHTGTGRTGTTNTNTTTDNNEEKPLSLIQNPTNRTDYENNSKYYQQEIDKLNAANDADKAKIATLNKEKAAVDEIISRYDKLGATVEKLPAPEQPKFDTGSIADYEDQLQKVNDDLRTRNLSEDERNSLLVRQAELQDKIDKLSGNGAVNATLDDEATLKNQISAAQKQLAVLEKRRKEIKEKMQGDLSPDKKLHLGIDLDGVNRQIDKTKGKIDDLNDSLKTLTKKNMRQTYGGSISQAADEYTALAKSMSASGDAGTNAAAMMSVVGQSMQQMGSDGAIAKIGATMAAIGQIILGFAEAQTQAAETMGPWGWIAFLGAGLAAVATTIATINSYATGGIVPGTSYTGDKVVAHVNSGEMILNARQQARLFAIASGSLSPSLPALESSPVSPNVTINSSGVSGGGMFAGGNVILKVKGRDLVGVMDNDGKIGKKIGRRTVTIG